MRLSRLETPTQAMMFCDSHNGGYNGSSDREGKRGFSAVYCKHCYSNSAYSLVNNAVSSRHQGGANCLMADGHAEWLKATRILSTGTDSLWSHNKPY